ncbi:MAG: hypothetical protein ACP5HM_03445 [Anaerolineae bacterium]
MTWGIRLAVSAVLVANLSAAVPFWLHPAAYAPAFELEGSVGEVLVRSLGLLFAMWVVPYLPAIWDPVRHRVCLSVIVVQQLVGLTGELWLWWTLPPGHAALRATGLRFILFDTAGLILLSGARWLAHLRRRQSSPNNAVSRSRNPGFSAETRPPST